MDAKLLSSAMHLLGFGHGLHRSHYALAHLLTLSAPTLRPLSPPLLTINFHNSQISAEFASIAAKSSSQECYKPVSRRGAHWVCVSSDWAICGGRRPPWRNWSSGSTTFAGEVGEEEEEEVEGGERKAPHLAVLLKEVVAHYEGRQVQSFVDCTLGAAGHSSAILKDHSELRTFIGLDVDPVAHEEAKPRLQARMSKNMQLHLVCTNFRNIKKAVIDVDVKLEDEGVDGILMDLGMSSMQVNTSERGFSFMKDGPTDMRMDPSASLTAGEILNKWPEAEVGRILRDYGEERRWRQLARKIVEQRLAGGIRTTAELVELIGGSTFGRPGRGKAVHPATRTFQALRIAVNDELRSLELALADAFALLAPKGRLAVISFHSLEDRIVKHFFLNAAGVGRAFVDDEADSDFVVAPEYLHIPGETRHSKYTKKKRLDKDNDLAYFRGKNVLEGSAGVILTKRPIVAGVVEINTNPRSRSAKLRVIEKL